MRGRILVVDDDNDVLEIFQLLLKRRYDVTTMTDAESLMNENQSEPYHLAIFDHRMRSVTSADLIPFLKNKPGWEDTHFVIHSGMADLKNVAALSGADGFLPKPSGIDEILGYVARVFENNPQAGPV